MFRAPPRPSSGAYNCINSLWFYRWSVGGSSVVGRGLARPQPTKVLPLPLTTERQQAEWNTIKTMAQNNNFPENLIANLKVQMEQQKVHQTQDKDEKTGNLHILQSKN